jgi:hypothetical protein
VIEMDEYPKLSDEELDLLEIEILDGTTEHLDKYRELQRKFTNHEISSYEYERLQEELAKERKRYIERLHNRK